MKKTLSIALVMLVIILMLTGCTKSGDDGNKPSNVRKENPASDFEYHISENKVLIKEYKGNDKDVVIPEKIEDSPVVAIALGAFGSSNIESIDIPDTVITIFDKAFTLCKNLHTVKMGNGVTDIGSEAFRGCKKLKTLTLSTNLTKIRSQAFAACESLETVYIPKSVTEWGIQVFIGCSLTSLTFEDGIKNIGNYACFWNNENLKSVIIPASVITLGEYSFDKSLLEVNFEGDCPTTIGNHPFDEETSIYYNKNASSWENSKLKDYKLIAK